MDREHTELVSTNCVDLVFSLPTPKGIQPVCSETLLNTSIPYYHADICAQTHEIAPIPSLDSVIILQPSGELDNKPLESQELV